MSVGNVHKSELSLVRLPDIAQEEDRGLKRCNKPNLVLADISDNSRYRNDITRVSFKVDVLTVELEKENGDVIAAPGLAVAFPHQTNAKGFMIDWRQLTKTPVGGGTVLDAQCYKVKITYELAGTSGEFYYGAYKLLPFNQINSRDTVQVFTVLNDVVRSIGINYKYSGFAGSVRFEGTFGYMQPNFETNNITYADRTRNKVRIEALRSYELRTSMLVGCMTSQIDEQHLLAANQIWITEHHPHAHIQYNQFPVILSEDGSPEIEYLAGGYAKLTAQFKDKVAVHESKYDGNIEAKINASFDLPQGVQASGCANGTNNIQQSDGTLIEAVTVPSGSTVNSPVADSPISLNGTFAQNVKATDPKNFLIQNTNGDAVGNVLFGNLEVPDSPITVNTDPFTDLPATQSLDIEVVDTEDNPVSTTIVGGKVQVNDLPITEILYDGVNFMIDPNAPYSWVTPETVAHSVVGFEKFNLLNSVGFGSSMWTLDGINQYVESQNNLLYTDRVNALTFHQFIFTPNNNTTQPLIAPDNFNASQGAFYLFRGSSVNVNDLLFRYYDSGGSLVNTIFSDFFLGFDNTNMLVSVVVDYTTGEAKAYRNGVLYSTETHTATKPTVGNNQRVGRVGGLYGEFRFGLTSMYNKLHSATEVQRLFNYFKADYGL